MQDFSHLGCSESSALIQVEKKNIHSRRISPFSVHLRFPFFQGWPGFFGPTGVAGPVGDKV